MSLLRHSSYFFSAVLVITHLFMGNSGIDAASDGSGVIKGVTVGIEGVYKNGFRTPITITTSGIAGTLELQAVDSDGTPAKISEIFNATSEKQTRTFYFPLGKSNGELTVRVLDENGQVVEERRLNPIEKKKGPAVSISDSSGESVLPERPPFDFPEPQDAGRSLYLLIGDENIGLNEAFGELRIKEERRPQVERIWRFSSLPDKWVGYDAVEMLIITTTDRHFFDGVKPDDPRIDALVNWVRFGGKILLVAGKDSRPIITKDGPLARLIPGTVMPDRLREIRIANAITQYVPKAKNLVMTGSLDAPFLNIPIVTDLSKDSFVDIVEMETPILIRSPLGLGSVTFFASDLARAPLLGWSGRSGLLIRMLGYDLDRTTVAKSDSLVQLGYTDLSGQLRSVLDRFAGVRNIPFSIILLLIFLYILIIGPGDWFITHRLIKRPNATWITFPIYIVLFCVLAVWLSQKVNPTDIRVNRVELIDSDQTTGIVRGTAWTGIYSPRDERYEFVFHTPQSVKSDQAEVWFSWLGLQGSGLGGMTPKTVSPQFWDEPYLFEYGRQNTVGQNSTGSSSNSSKWASLSSLPIQVHSTKSLIGRWTWQPLDKVNPEITLKDNDGIPMGTIVNSLKVPLENAMLFYGRWAFDLGTLAPGETSLTTKTPKMERYQAIGTSIAPFAEASKNLTNRGISRYNPESTDIPYILRTMMFYELGGGRDTIGLNNSLQHDIDLSDQIRLGRAVLIGTVRDDSPEKKTGAAVELPEVSLSGLPTSPLVIRTGNAAGDQTEIPYTDSARHRHTVIMRTILPVGK